MHKARIQYLLNIRLVTRRQYVYAKSEYVDNGSLVIYDKTNTYHVLTKNDIINTNNKSGDLYSVTVMLPSGVYDIYVASFGFIVRNAYYMLSGPVTTLTTIFTHDNTTNDSLNYGKFLLDYSPKVNIDFDDDGNKIFKSAELKADMSKYKYFSTLKYEGNFDSIKIKTLGKGIGLIFVNSILRQIIHENRSDSVQDYFIDGSQGLDQFEGKSNKLEILFFNNFEDGIYYDTTITELELYNSDKIKYQDAEFGELFETDANGDAKIIVQNMVSDSLSTEDDAPLMLYNPDITYNYATTRGYVRKATLVCPNTFVKNTTYTLKFKLKNKRSVSMPFPDGVCIVCAGGYDYTPYSYAKGYTGNYDRGWGEITMTFTPTSNTQKLTLYAYSGSVIKDLYIPEFDYYFKYSDLDQAYDSYSEPPKPATNDGTYITYGYGKCISFYKYTGKIVALWPNGKSDGSSTGVAIKSIQTIDSDTILSKFNVSTQTKQICQPGYDLSVYSPTTSRSYPAIIFNLNNRGSFTLQGYSSPPYVIGALVFEKSAATSYSFKFQYLLENSSKSGYFKSNEVETQYIYMPSAQGPRILLIIPLIAAGYSKTSFAQYNLRVDVASSGQLNLGPRGIAFSAEDYSTDSNLCGNIEESVVKIGPLFCNMVTPAGSLADSNKFVRYLATPNGYNTAATSIPRVYSTLEDGVNFNAFYIPGVWIDCTFKFFVEIDYKSSSNTVEDFKLMIMRYQKYGGRCINHTKVEEIDSNKIRFYYEYSASDVHSDDVNEGVLFMMITKMSKATSDSITITVSFPTINTIPDAYFYAEKAVATENAVATQSELIDTPPSGILSMTDTCEGLAHNKPLRTSSKPHFYGIELLDASYTKIKFGLSNSLNGFTYKFIATGSSSTYGLCDRIARYEDDSFVDTDKQIFFINMATPFGRHDANSSEIGMITDFILQKADGSQLHIDADNFDSYSSIVKKITVTDIGSNLINFAPNTLRVFKIDNYSQGLKYNVLNSYVSISGQSSHSILLGTNTINQNGNITYEFFTSYKKFDNENNRETVLVAFPTDLVSTSTYVPIDLTLELTKYNQNSMIVKLPANLTIWKPSLNFKNEVIIGMNLDDVSDLEFIPVTGTKVYLDDNEETLTVNTLKQYNFRYSPSRSIMFVKNIVNEDDLSSSDRVTYIAKNVLKNLTGEITIEMPKSIYTDINLFLKNTYNTSTTYANKNMSILYSVNSDLFKREKILNSDVLQPNFKFSKPEDHLLIFKDENKLKVGPLYILDIEGESDYTINEEYAETEYIPDPGDRNNEKYLIAFNTLNNLSDNMKEKNIVEDKNEIVQQVKIFKRDETSASFKMRVTYDYTWLRNVLNTDTYVSMEDIQGSLYGIAYGASKRTLSRNLTFMPIN